MAYEDVRDRVVARMKELRRMTARDFRRHRPRFVTLSPRAGTRGDEVAESLARKLVESGAGSPHRPWIALSRETFDQLLLERVVEDRDMSLVEKKPAPELRERIRLLGTLYCPSSPLTVRRHRTILHLASMGNIVLVDPGAETVTKGIPGGLRVRLVASASHCRRSVKTLLGMDDDEARRWVEEEDDLRSDYVFRIFKKDIEDPLLYQLVLNMEGLDPEAAAVVIAEALLVHDVSTMPAGVR